MTQHNIAWNFVKSLLVCMKAGRPPRRKALVALAFVSLALSAAPAVADTPSPTVLVNMIGTNIHMHNGWAGEVYGNVPNVEAALSYAGIRHARDVMSWLNIEIAAEQKINHDIGVKFDIFWGGELMNNIINNASIVEAIEGDNEPENFSSVPGSAAAQKVLWQGAKADPATQNIPVYSMSLVNFNDAAIIGNMAPYSDQIALHNYPQFAGSYGTSTYSFMQSQMGLNDALAPGKPQVITEGGWWTAPCAVGTTEAAQAKLMLSYLLDAYSLGVTRVYFYELMDGHAAKTSIEDCLGIYHFDFSPKPAATGFHNLNIILGDSGAASHPGTLAYNLTGMPAKGHSALFERSDGAFVLALWRDDEIWDNNGHEVWLAPATVTLTPAVATTSMAAYNALLDTNPIATTTAASMQISLSDTPIFVIIRAGAVQPPSLPDVIVTSLSYSSATGAFTSVVKNQGTASTPAGVFVGVSYSVDGAYHTWGGVAGPLAAGASVTIGTQGGAYAIPNGTHTITAFVDDVNRFAESNEANNTLSQSITVGSFIESKSGTTIPPATTIVDSAGNTWTVSGGVIYENGQKSALTMNVIKLTYVNGLVYQENINNDWWAWVNNAWKASPAPL